MSLIPPLSNFEGQLLFSCPVKWWGKGVQLSSQVSRKKGVTSGLREHHSEVLDFQWDVVTG